MKSSIACLIVVTVSAFELTCPSGRGWNKTATTQCSKIDNYICLFDEVENKYTETCSGPMFDRAGNKKNINNGNFNRAKCSSELYQPVKFSTIGHSDCLFLKSFCSEEGQVVVDNGTTMADRKCRCDYRKGYAFLSNSNHPCHCIPSEEDCSCYMKRCGPDEILSPDYECVPVIEQQNKYQCLFLKDEAVNLTKSGLEEEKIKGRKFIDRDLAFSFTVPLLVLVLVLFGVLWMVLFLKRMQIYDHYILCTTKENKDTRFGERCTTCNSKPSVYWCYECKASLCDNYSRGCHRLENHHIQHVQDKYILDYTFNVNRAFISDIKLISDELLCISDSKGNQLVTVDITDHKQQYILLADSPLCITVVDTSTVAVTLGTGFSCNVLMVDIREGGIITPIDVKGWGLGIMYRNNQLFVGCSDNIIKVVSMSGEITRTIPLSFLPRYICCSDDGRIYCTDLSKLYCIDTEGNILFTCLHPDMNEPRYITTDDTGHVLVACNRSKNMLSISPDGKQCQVIVKQILLPCICYNPQSKSLVVGRGGSIDVYKQCNVD